VVVHAYNPSTRQEDYEFGASLGLSKKGKKVSERERQRKISGYITQKPCRGYAEENKFFTQIKVEEFYSQAQVAHTCNPSCQEAEIKRSTVQS
jgi:hypothetical protein